MSPRALAAAVALAAACHTSSTPSVAEQAAAACSNWGTLGCKSGADSDCAYAFANAAQDGGLAPGALSCAAKATSLEAFSACDPAYFVCGAP